MKASAKQYAIALFESIDGKKGKELESVLDNFTKMIMALGSGEKIDLILSKFIEVWNERNKELDLELVSARKLDTSEEKFIKDELIRVTDIKNINVDKKIDPSILGGVILKYDGKILDLSYKEKIKQLKDTLNKE